MANHCCSHTKFNIDVPLAGAQSILNGWSLNKWVVSLRLPLLESYVMQHNLVLHVFRVLMSLVAVPKSPSDLGHIVGTTHASQAGFKYLRIRCQIVTWMKID